MKASNRFKSVLLISTFSLLLSCSQKQATLFELLDNEAIGMSFSNDLGFSNEFNVYKYRNFYNGGGVSIGDVNNDGLADVYLTANQLPNRLFLNQGDFKFKDITETAGVAGEKAWATGVTMVDINADGLLDIYVCNSGDVKGDNKQSELFINNGDLTFTEKAAEYGLADPGYSTHATFFDYDKDGDLDAYLLNNSYQAIGSFDLRRNERPKRDEMGGDKLMENQNGVFVDVSEKAGIYGSVIGFGLGVSVGDVNNDGWEDIFVSNDFFERDYLYLNQQDGTFKETLTEQMRSISGASMGADMADLNNDGYNDIFVTEMLPSDYQRLKTVTTFEDWNKYQYNVKNGYHHQFTRNMLHLNNGNDSFSEIGRWANIEASDWSWGALFFDMDNDGYKDLFIANGIYQDLTDQDYLQYVASEEVIKSIVSNNQVDYQRLIDIIPSNKVPNHAYKNNGELGFDTFENSGLALPSFSNGSAYGDLDNDGDLDLIVNNVNMPLFVFKNKAEKTANNYLKISLKGPATNPNAIGARIKVSTSFGELFQEVQPVRGFQSSMEVHPTIGVGKDSLVDVTVTWPSGKISQREKVKVNTLLSFDSSTAKEEKELPSLISNDLFTAVAAPKAQHKENNFVDFHRERLTYHMLSTPGPKISFADFDQDGTNEMVFPGAKGYPTQILVETSKGWDVDQRNAPLFDQLKDIEHTNTALFDIDQDGDQDMIMLSGSIETSIYSLGLFDVVLVNQGDGTFVKSDQYLPNDSAKINTQAVAYADVDSDGDLDLFIGERSKVGNYGLPGSGFILINDGQGNFSDQTTTLAPGLNEIGMITSALFHDFDEDNDPDLLITGEFMGLHFFENNAGKFTVKDHALTAMKGWWNSLHLVDLNQDGRKDLIVGNHGTNSRFKTSKAQPIKLYFNDFDENGRGEGVLTATHQDGKEYPFALRHNLIDQMKSLKKKFPNFESFKAADMTKIFTPKALNESLVLEAIEFKTMAFLNKGDYNFTPIDLPKQVQFSPVYAINHGDFDGDGDMDVLMGGNLYKTKPEVGSYDASYGLYLENTPDGFIFHPNGKGFNVKGEIRSIEINKNTIWVGRTDDTMSAFRFESK
ncbi:MAG: VCBS repeat-containing protein [Flavobacteriaceae bacterium]